MAAAVSTRFAQRSHPDLAGANVRALSRSMIAHELQWRLQRREGWQLMTLRNRWFQDEVGGVLPELPGRVVLFAHSYSAEAILIGAKRRGWTTVLGQIDPGPEHVLTQEKIAAARVEFGAAPEGPPAGYFERWRRECELADWIVVNSDWSRDALMRAGVAAAKLKTIPLPYEAESGQAIDRSYPLAFSEERPLRVLFVGTATVAKGVADLLLALERLGGVPIEVHIVGDEALQVPDRFKHDARLRWHGRVDRAAVADFYRSSDVLIFPSHSDGFGLVQIEAQAWRLPIIASRHCGRVVRHGETGFLLDEVSPAAIASALGRAAAEPETLARFSQEAGRVPAPGLDALAAALIALETA